MGILSVSAMSVVPRWCSGNWLITDAPSTCPTIRDGKTVRCTPIIYTVTEADVEDGTADVSGFVLTNRFDGNRSVSAST